MEEEKPNFHPKFWITSDGEYKLEEKDPNTIRVREKESLYECVFVKGQNRYSFDHLREYVLLSLYRKDLRLQNCVLCKHFIRRDPEEYIGNKDRCEEYRSVGQQFNNCASFIMNEEGAESICKRNIEIDEIFSQPLSFQKKTTIDCSDNLLNNYSSQKKTEIDGYDKMLEELY